MAIDRSRSSRSSRRRVRKVLGILFLVSGLGFLYAAVQILNRRVLSWRLKNYYQRLGRSTAGPIPTNNFPIAYFRSRLKPGSSSAEISGTIVGGRLVGTTSHVARGAYAEIYSFPFSFAQRHRLFILFDANARLLDIEGENLSIDLG